MAAVVVPLFWEQGTLIAAAVTPIVVGIGAVGVWRRTAGGIAVRAPGRPRPADEQFEPLPGEEHASGGR